MPGVQFAWHPLVLHLSALEQTKEDITSYHRQREYVFLWHLACKTITSILIILVLQKINFRYIFQWSMGKISQHSGRGYKVAWFCGFLTGNS